MFKLGEELVSRNIKVNELVAKWAKRGEEPVSKQEFRVAVRKFLEKTIKPEVKEIDELFDLFDTEYQPRARICAKARAAALVLRREARRGQCRRPYRRRRTQTGFQEAAGRRQDCV